MAGNYRKLKSGKWELTVSCGFDEVTGKRIRKFKTVDASGPRDAEKLLAQFFNECKTTQSYNDDITIENFSKLWMKDYVEANLKKKTISDYRDILERVVFSLGTIKLKELKPTHLIRFYTMLGEDGSRKDGKSGGLSPKTIKHHHLVISSMLNSAYQWELIKENICNRVSPPKQNKIPIQIITINQAKELLNALEKESIKYRLIVMLAIFTGFRRGEIMGLEWNDVNFTENTVTVERTSSYTADFGIFEDIPKTYNSVRTTYVPELITSLINDYKIYYKNEKQKCGDKWFESNRIFTQWNGKPMSPDSISKWFPKFVRRHNLSHTSLHGLRHAHGSILLALGLDPASVSDQLGHSNLQMLFQVYGHNVKKNSKEVAEFMKKALLDENEDTNIK